MQPDGGMLRGMGNEIMPTSYPRPDVLLSARQTASALGISRRTLRRRVRNGALPEPRRINGQDWWDAGAIHARASFVELLEDGVPITEADEVVQSIV
jgi:predicted DNA-binding transcriptional regulator AlpA